MGQYAAGRLLTVLEVRVGLYVTTTTFPMRLSLVRLEWRLSRDGEEFWREFAALKNIHSLLVYFMVLGLTHSLYFQLHSAEINLLDALTV